MQKLVTICITTYNRKNLLSKALKSILKQTYNNLEIIIVDDCSTDGTKLLVENDLLKLDKRIRYIRHKENKGLASARNSAISRATGKYFTFCDDDDILEKTFVEEFVKVANDYSSEWCFTCGNIYQNKKGELIRKYPNYEASLKELIQKGYTPPVAAQFYCLESLKKVNGYNELIKSGVDHDLWLRLSSQNVKVLGLRKALSRPNILRTITRMTTSPIKRVNDIMESLEIWKDDISKNYSSEFYAFFRQNYIYYLDKKFLKQSIRAFDIKSFFMYAYKINKYFLLKDIMKILYKRIFRNNEIKTPLFFSY